MKLKFLKPYDSKSRKGQDAIVDKILFDKTFASGVKVRVVNIWKKPKYLDIGWFVKAK